MSIRLLSSDGEEFVVRKEAAEQSVFIENMMVDGEPESAISLPNVTGKVLEKVIEWCDHHIHDTAEEAERRRITSEMDDWDQTFFQVDQELLFDVILAANYLDIKGLLNAGCMTVSSQIKGKSAAEINRLYNIVDDFTPEEVAQIKIENNWMQDMEDR